MVRDFEDVGTADLLSQRVFGDGLDVSGEEYGCTEAIQPEYERGIVGPARDGPVRRRV